MRVPKPKDRCVKKANLRNLDGVRDVSFGDADIDARRAGNFKKGGTAGTPETDYDDDKARRERYGFPF